MVRAGERGLGDFGQILPTLDRKVAARAEVSDGALLAWSERGTEVSVLSSAGGTPALVADDFRLDRFVWAGRRTLAFTIFEEGLHLYDADSGTAAPVPSCTPIPTSTAYRPPRTAPC